MSGLFDMKISVLARGYVGDLVFLFTPGRQPSLALWREIKENYPHFKLNPTQEMNVTEEWIADNVHLFGRAAPIFDTEQNAGDPGGG